MPCCAPGTPCGQKPRVQRPSPAENFFRTRERPPYQSAPCGTAQGPAQSAAPFPRRMPPLSSVIMMPKIIRSPGVWRKTVSSFPGQHWGYRSPGTWENTLRTAWAGTAPELPRRMGRCTREKTHLHLPRHDEARCPAPAAPIRQGLPAFPARRDVPALLRKGYSGTCPLPHAAGHASPAETYAPRRSRPRTAERLPVPAENTNVGFPCAPEPLPFPPWKGGRMGMAAPRKIPVRKMPLPRLTCPPFPHAGTCLPFCKKDILGHARFPTQRDTPPRRRHMPRAGAAPARRNVCPFRPKIQMSDSPARRSFCPFCHGKADAWAWHNTGTYR